MSPWLKLLLLVLVTLVLPWDGIRYARQMESALRQSERQALRTRARTLAASLQGRSSLLYRFPGSAARPGPYDLTPVQLPDALYVDGYMDGWPTGSKAWRRYGHGAHRFAGLTGVHGRMLYVLLRVHDPRVIFDAPLADPLRRSAIGDRVWIGYDDPQGLQHAEFFALTGAGPLVARRLVRGEYGREQSNIDPRIVGALEPRPGGYEIEMTMPLSLIGGRFGVLVDDRDRRGAAPLSYGTLRSTDLHTRGRLIAASSALPAYLARFIRPGLKLAIATPEGIVLAANDELAVPQVPAPQPGILARLFRRLVGPHGVTLIEASAPIYDSTHRRLIGELRVVQNSSRWAELRDRALERMLDLTLATSLVAFLVALVLAVQLLRRGWRRQFTRAHKPISNSLPR